VDLDADQLLMLKVRQGDREAFARLYEKFKRPIMAYVSSAIANKTQVEELTQDVFLKIYRSRESYEPRAKFSTWLWTIARNAVLDHFRKKGELLAQDLSPHDEEGSDPVAVDQLESPLSDSETELIARTQTAQIEDCMRRLSGPQREALQLRIFSDLSYEEVAGSLDVSITSVKTLIHRAKQGLIDCMKRKGEAHASQS